MSISVWHHRLPVLLALAIAGCAAAPVFRPASPPLAVAPDGAAAAPGRYGGAEVVWGGRIIEVRNGAGTSEITILAFPLDGGQRPLPREPDLGRFIAVLPGYVERYDYAPGRFVSVLGKLASTRAENAGERGYDYPLVATRAIHLWRRGFEKGGPQVRFGIGIRGAIR